MITKLKEGGRSIVVSIGFIAVILLAATLIVCSVTAPHDDVRFWGDGSSLYIFNDNWTLIDGEKTEVVNLPINNSPEIINTTVVVKNTMPDTFVGDHMLFRSSLQGVTITVDGEVIHDYGHFEKVFGRNNGSIWNIISLPKNYQGKTIEITVDNPYESRKGIVNGVYIGSCREIVGFLLYSYGFSLVCIAITLIIGVSLFIYFMFLRLSGIKVENRMLLVALLAVFSSLWQFTECKLTQIIVGNMAGFSAANFTLLIIMIIPGLMYVDEVENRVYHKWFNSFEFLLEINCIVQIILQVFEIADFYEMLWATHVLLIVSCAFAVVSIIYRYIKDRNREVRVVMSSVIVLAAASLYETLYCDITGYVNGKLLTAAVVLMILSTGIDSVRVTFATIQESRRAVEENAQKSTFLANMSHEIRTPMNAICAMSELLTSSEDISANDRDFAKTIHSSAEHLLEIINDILDYSKISADKYDIINEYYNLSNLVSDIKEIIAVRAAEKNIDFAIDVNPNIPYELIGDQTRIRQILINLLNNAVKFTNKGGVELDIDYEKTGDTEINLILKVIDTGVGIDEKEFSGLFEAFTQVDKARNRSVEGTGLGLAISRAIARLMGGDITVKSTLNVGSEFTAVIKQGVLGNKTYAADMDEYFKKKTAWPVIIVEDDSDYMDSLEIGMKGSGATVKVFREEDLDLALENQPKSVVVFSTKEHAFLLSEEFRGMHPYSRLVGVADCLEMVDTDLEVEIIRLPATVVDYATLIKPPVKEKTVIEFEAPFAKILVVDDNTINLRVMKEMLSKFKITPTLCSNGVQAVEAMKAKGFDLIFMDHMMPGMDGIETTRLIREIPETGKKVSVIALSANAVKGAEKIYKDNGLDGYLAKPVSINAVGKTLKKYLPNYLITEVKNQ